jgi:hypothetical protein
MLTCGFEPGIRPVIRPVGVGGVPWICIGFALARVDAGARSASGFRRTRRRGARHTGGRSAESSCSPDRARARAARSLRELVAAGQGLVNAGAAPVQPADERSLREPLLVGGDERHRDVVGFVGREAGLRYGPTADAVQSDPRTRMSESGMDMTRSLAREPRAHLARVRLTEIAARSRPVRRRS